MTGRQSGKSYLVSHAVIVASAIAVASIAPNRALSIASSPADSDAELAMESQCPDAVNVPAPSAQNTAEAWLKAEAPPIWPTVNTSLKSVIQVALPTVGGGGGFKL